MSNHLHKPSHRLATTQKLVVSNPKREFRRVQRDTLTPATDVSKSPVGWTHYLATHDASTSIPPTEGAIPKRYRSRKFYESKPKPDSPAWRNEEPYGKGPKCYARRSGTGANQRIRTSL